MIICLFYRAVIGGSLAFGGELTDHILAWKFPLLWGIFWELLWGLLWELVWGLVWELLQELLSGISLGISFGISLDHIASCLANFDSFCICLSNMDTRDLNTYPRTNFEIFHFLSVPGLSFFPNFGQA